MAKHTPKPWAAFTDDSGSEPHTNIVAVTPSTSCVFSLPGRDKSEADVMLISQAPEMFDLIRRFEQSAQSSHNYGFFTDSELERMARVVALVEQSEATP